MKINGDARKLLNWAATEFGAETESRLQRAIDAMPDGQPVDFLYLQQEVIHSEHQKEISGAATAKAARCKSP